MCNFFSFCSDGKENYLYSNWADRQKLLGKDESPDSHTYILTANNIKPQYQDRYSKYEYNPLTKYFNIDEPVEGHDHQLAKDWVEKLDFKAVVPDLVIKPIVHPFNDVIPPSEITEEILEKLREWNSVWNSVGNSVWNSVVNSVGNSVGNYISSFFDTEYKFDNSSGLYLWKHGLVPSFDGTTWRLHGGKEAKILWEGKL